MSTEQPRPTQKDSRLKWIGVIAGIVIAAFLIGLVPMWLKGRSAAGERIKLTRYNKTVAIVIPKRDLEILEDCEEKQPEAEQPAERPRRARAKTKQTR